MRKSVTVVVEGSKSHWWLPNKHKKVILSAPSELELNKLGLKRTLNYKAIYSPDPNGTLRFSGDHRTVPDVREIDSFTGDYVDTCFLKDSGWVDGTILKRVLKPF